MADTIMADPAPAEALHTEAKLTAAASWDMSDTETFVFQVIKDSWLLPETLTGIQELFGVLDRTKTGTLRPTDFEEEQFQAVKEKLQKMWEVYEEGFDLNKDREISLDEFVSGFLRLALKETFAAMDDGIMDTGLAHLTQWIRELNEKVAAFLNEQAAFIGMDAISLRKDKGLDRVSTAANHLIAEIGNYTSEEKAAIAPLRQLINSEQGKKRNEIFQLLDRNQDGQLDKDDFNHHLPVAQDMLNKLWTEIQLNFDVSGDQVVTMDEIDSGIIWNAVRSQYPEQESGQGIEMIVTWITHFMTQMTKLLDDFSATVKSM